jgi:hypothetical protein
MPFLSDSTLGLACAGGVYKLLDWCDDNLRAESRQELTRWLTNGSSIVPAQVFAGLIDLVFGRKVRSVNFFLRSCAASLLALTVVLFVYARMATVSLDFKNDVIPLFMLYGLASLVPAYISINISRCIVLAMAARPTKPRVTALAFLDFVLKAALGSLTVYSASLILHFGEASAWQQAWRALTSFYFDGNSALPFMNADGVAYGLLFYPVFFSSTWIWLYMAGGIVTKTIARIQALSRFFVHTMDIEKHPLRSAGLVLVLLTFVVVLGLSPLFAANSQP